MSLKWEGWNATDLPRASEPRDYSTWEARIKSLVIRIYRRTDGGNSYWVLCCLPFFGEQRLGYLDVYDAKILALSMVRQELLDYVELID